MRRHQTWAISHQLDIIPQCFAGCGSKQLLSLLPWWGDWNIVGQKITIQRVDNQRMQEMHIRLRDKIQFSALGLLMLWVLFASSLCAIPVSALHYLRHKCFFQSMENPPRDWRAIRGESDHLPDKNVGVNYHSLQKYIELLKDDDVFDKAPSKSDNQHPTSED